MKPEKQKHFWLYVLKLEQGKYYVGITSQTVEKRFQEHVSGIRRANWTAKYRPLSIHDRKDLGITTRAGAETFENRVVRQYIKKYGNNSTRGGDLTDTGNYAVRFGHIYSEDDWKMLTVVVLLLLTIIVLLLTR